MPNKRSKHRGRQAVKTEESQPPQEPLQSKQDSKELKKPLHPEFLANQWKPGQSGNPGGRAKNLSKMLAYQLAEKVPNDPEKRSYAQLLIEAGVKRAISKSDVLFKEIFDRIEGKLQPEPEEGAIDRSVRVVVLDVARPPRPAIPEITIPAKASKG